MSLTRHTVRRSVITLTTLPAPAISTTFSCQLSSTLIACPLLSVPDPIFLPPICEKPVDCGVMLGLPGDGVEEVAAVWEADMPLYLVLISLLHAMGRCEWLEGLSLG